MRYKPTDIAAIDIPIAQRPRLGYESELQATRDQAIPVADLRAVADGSGLMTRNAITVAAGLITSGRDLVVRVRNLKADAAVTVTVPCTFADDSVGTCSATLTPPETVSDQTYNFSEGHSWDLIGDGGGAAKSIKSVNVGAGLLLTNALRNSELEIWALPHTAANWQTIPNLNSISREGGTSPAVPVPDGKDGSRDVVPGRSDPASVSIELAYRSGFDGLYRYAGEPACFMEIKKAQRKLVVEQHVYANCTVQVNPNSGSGNDTGTTSASGFMEKFFMFAAVLE